MGSGDSSKCLATVRASDPEASVASALARVQSGEGGDYVLLHDHHPAVARLGLRSGVGCVPACKVERSRASESDAEASGDRCWKISKLPAARPPV